MAERNARTITTLNENDVLLGRGRGPSQYVGNQKFLSLVKTKKQEYNCKHVPNKTKAAIANEIYCKITEDRGGRFLSLVNENGQRTRNLVEEGVWVVVHKDHAIEKVKQGMYSFHMITYSLLLYLMYYNYCFFSITPTPRKG